MTCSSYSSEEIFSVLQESCVTQNTVLPDGLSNRNCSRNKNQTAGKSNRRKHARTLFHGGVDFPHLHGQIIEPSRALVGFCLIDGLVCLVWTWRVFASSTTEPHSMGTPSVDRRKRWRIDALSLACVKTSSVGCALFGREQNTAFYGQNRFFQTVLAVMLLWNILLLSGAASVILCVGSLRQQKPSTQPLLQQQTNPLRCGDSFQRVIATTFCAIGIV